MSHYRRSSTERGRYVEEPVLNEVGDLLVQFLSGIDVVHLIAGRGLCTLDYHLLDLSGRRVGVRLPKQRRSSRYDRGGHRGAAAEVVTLLLKIERIRVSTGTKTQDVGSGSAYIYAVSTVIGSARPSVLITVRSDGDDIGRVDVAVHIRVHYLSVVLVHKFRQQFSVVAGRDCKQNVLHIHQLLIGGVACGRLAVAAAFADSVRHIDDYSSVAVSILKPRDKLVRYIFRQSGMILLGKRRTVIFFIRVLPVHRDKRDPRSHPDNSYSVRCCPCKSCYVSSVISMGRKEVFRHRPYRRIIHSNVLYIAALCRGYSIYSVFTHKSACLVRDSGHIYILVMQVYTRIDNDKEHMARVVSGVLALRKGVPYHVRIAVRDMPLVLQELIVNVWIRIQSVFRNRHLKHRILYCA